MFKPVYKEGRFTAVSGVSRCVPLDERNADYRDFLIWLTAQGKTLEAWLAENPPPPRPGYAALRRAAYQAEADPLLPEALYDKFGPPADSLKFTDWAAKVAEIKTRFPKTT